MRVGVDVRKIEDGGIGTYIRELLERLIPADPGNHYTLFFAPRDFGRYDYSWGNVTKRVNRSGKYSLGEHLSFPLEARKEKLQLFFSPHYTKSWWMPCPTVTTVHDLIHLRFPEYLPHPLAEYYARVMIGRACRTSEVVITVSQATKRDLLELFKIDASKIKVIYNGVDHEVYRPLEDDEGIVSFRQKHDLLKPFVLYVGALRSHKNLPTLLRAYSQSTLRGEFDVVIATFLRENREPIEKLAADLGLRDNLRYLLSLRKEELVFLYNSAHFLVLPSFYEGFGLPPLEAMACGCPVIVSNRASLPEVVGEAGLLFDPTAPEELLEKMNRLAKEESLRQKLRQVGRVQGKKFTWEKTAEATLMLLRGLQPEL